MKILGFNMQQRGDIFMASNLLHYLNSAGHEVVLGIANRYVDMLPLFDNCFHIHVWSSYDGVNKEEFDSFCVNNRIDIACDPMASHTCDDWYAYRHQIDEMYLVHGMNKFITLSDSIKRRAFLIKLSLIYNFSPLDKVVAFFPFGGQTSDKFKNNDKSLTVENAQKIVDILLRNKYKVIQLGASFEPKLNDAYKPSVSYFEAMRIAYESSLCIGVDTGLMWGISAYSRPCIGLYSNKYYGKENVKNIMPQNHNAIYLSSDNLNNILLEEVLPDSLKNFKI